MAAPPMFRHAVYLTVLASIGLTLTVTCPASPQSANPPSLGELAQRQRADHAKDSGKPVKTYTNDNLPGGGNLTIIASPEGGSGANTNGKPETVQRNHDEKYYRDRAQELKNQFEIHQRELDVLQQELGENQVQYYSNPSQGLQQQYSREDINGDRTAIDQKQQQVNADQQAISDLEDDLRREGGDPQWLETEGPQATTPAVKVDLSGTQKGSEEYWRRRFNAAREALASAQEQRQVADDELRLLQSQQAHDWGTATAESAEPKIAEKQKEVDAKRAAEAQAQQELDSLENEFR